MRSFKKIFILLIIILIMSGCYQSETTLTINSDRSVDLNVKVLVDDNFNDKYYSSNMSLYEKRGIKIDRITEYNSKGYLIFKKYKNIDEISSESDISVDITKYLDDNFNEQYLFKVEKDNFKNKYIANFNFNSANIKNKMTEKIETESEFIEKIKDIFDKTIADYEKDKKEKNYSSEKNELELSSDIVYKISIDKDGKVNLDIKDNNYSYKKENVLLKDIVEADVVKLNNTNKSNIKFIVKLPVKVLENNANEVSTTGQTLTWVLDPDKNSMISFSFELVNKENYIVIFSMIAGILLLITLLTITIIILKSKNRKKVEDKPIYKSEENKPNIESQEVAEVINIDDEDNTTI